VEFTASLAAMAEFVYGIGAYIQRCRDIDVVLEGQDLSCLGVYHTIGVFHRFGGSMVFVSIFPGSIYLLFSKTSANEESVDTRTLRLHGPDSEDTDSSAGQTSRDCGPGVA
jgi:hypothetical protein